MTCIESRKSQIEINAGVGVESARVSSSRLPDVFLVPRSRVLKPDLKYFVDDLLCLLAVDGHGDLLGGVHPVQLAHQLRLPLLQQRAEHLESLVYLRLGHLHLKKKMIKSVIIRG